MLCERRKQKVPSTLEGLNATHCVRSVRSLPFFYFTVKGEDQRKARGSKLQGFRSRSKQAVYLFFSSLSLSFSLSLSLSLLNSRWTSTLFQLSLSLCELFLSFSLCVSFSVLSSSSLTFSPLLLLLLLSHSLTRHKYTSGQ